MRPVTNIKLGEKVQSPDMAKFPALCLVVACAAASAQNNPPTVKFEVDVPAVNLNGGLNAQLLFLGRVPSGFGGRPLLTSAVKISNPGKDYAFLIFYDIASAIDGVASRNGI
jgi:hypothetical protein